MEISHWSILKLNTTEENCAWETHPHILQVSRHKSPAKPSLNYPLPQFKFYMKIDPFKP